MSYDCHVNGNEHVDITSNIDGIENGYQVETNDVGHLLPVVLFFTIVSFPVSRSKPTISYDRVDGVALSLLGVMSPKL